MTLEERAAKARSLLFERYDELNLLWTQAEKQLTQSHVPHAVECEIDSISESEDHPEALRVVCLGLQKIKGEWRICHGSYASWCEPGVEHWSPIVECSAEIRVDAAKHLPKLQAAVVESAEKFIPRVNEAIETLAKAMSKEVSLDEMLAQRAKLNGRKK